MRSAEVTMTVALAGCCRVCAFMASPPSVLPPDCTPRGISSASCTSTQLPTRISWDPRKSALILAATDNGDKDPLDIYRQQMSEFITQSHERRLEAIDAVKVEVQRGYEEQIAELRAQLAALSPSSPAASERASQELAVVGAVPASLSQDSGSGVTSLHPAYAARSGRPGWEARWGPEEVHRASALASSTEATNVPFPGIASADPVAHPSYSARLNRPGWEARWGAEEVARVLAATNTASVARDFVEARSAPLSSNVHPAYSARMQRPGWDSRWGPEEAHRVENTAAGVVAAAGAAAGFISAGGLDSAREVGADEAEKEKDEPIVDNFLPDDVDELKQMVASFRRNFQEYLIRSLDVSTQLRSSKTSLEKELMSAKDELAKEKELRANGVQASASPEDTSRRGDEAQLGDDVFALTAEVAELKRFAQEYMIKASYEKMKAVEDAKASVQAQTSERLAALEAKVFDLQGEK